VTIAVLSQGVADGVDFIPANITPPRPRRTR